jgi:hypothetical protein
MLNCTPAAFDPNIDLQKMGLRIVCLRFCLQCRHEWAEIADR